MTRIEVKKGNTIESLNINEENIIAILDPQRLPENTNQRKIVEESMLHPIGTKKLKEIVRPGETVAIMTSDLTRPVPSFVILPPILSELKEAGIRKEDITIYFAIGSHRNQTPEEMEKLVGKEVYENYRCVDSDIHHVTHVGYTKRGTPVDIDSRVVEADRRICVGNVEFHYFAGFSGGAKAIMPGMSTPEAISFNHSLMVDPNACAGNLETNPVRMDLEEACAMVGVDFIVNVVLNTHKEVIYSASGDITLAHRDACHFLEKIYRSPIQEKADIVIVSQGGAPKDVNLYQMQKALDNSKYAVKDGGTIILVGSCKENFGQKTFEEWMLKYKNPDDMIQALRDHFILGGHKATAVALVRKKADIYLVSDMKDDLVSKTFLQPFATLESAFESAMKKHGKNARVIIMPYGGSTLPVLL